MNLRHWTQPCGRKAHWIQCLPRRVKGCLFWTSGYQEVKRGYLEERKRCFYSLSCLFWLCTCVCGVHGLQVLHVIFFSTFVPFSLSQVMLQGIPSITQLFWPNLTSSNNCVETYRVWCKFWSFLPELSILQAFWHFFALFLTRGREKLTQIQISCFSAACSIDTCYWWFSTRMFYYVSSMCLWG